MSTENIYRAAAANIGIAVFKFIGAKLTGSPTMFTEGIHSIADTLNQVLLMVGMWLSMREPDETHPLGYGNERFFWPMIVGFIIFGLGAYVSFLEGYHGLMHPSEIDYGSFNLFGVTISKWWVPNVVLMGAITLEGWAFIGAYRDFRQEFGDMSLMQALHETKDPSLVVLIFEDGAAVTSLFIAMIGYNTSYWCNSPVLDASASIAIAIILALTSVFIIAKCWWLMRGVVPASITVHDKIKNIIMWADFDMETPVKRRIGVEHINEIVAFHHGPDDIVVCVSVDFVDRIRASHVETVVSMIDREIKENIPNVVRVFVEAQSFSSHRSIQDEDEGEDFRIPA